VSRIEVDRVPFSVRRWVWTVDLGGGWSVSGWTFSKRGALRAARRAAESEGAA
jgi:hypothetical protein